GPSPSGVSQVDAVEPVEVAVDSGAATGAEPAGAGSGGAGSGGAETVGATLRFAFGLLSVCVHACVHGMVVGHEIIKISCL
ncbi:unnamed protein product, partial [Closterium sp. NIES-54]